ncbi:FG-GAP repeat domain-containing protein [Methanopyrus kandleri]
MLPLLVALLLVPSGTGAVELKYPGMNPGNSNLWPGKGLLTDPAVAWTRPGYYYGTVADEGVVLVDWNGNVVLVDPRSGETIRRLATVPVLNGDLLVARVKGRELVVGVSVRSHVRIISMQSPKKLVTVDLKSSDVESTELPGQYGRVVGCLDVDGDGDDEVLVLSDGLRCYELSPPRLKWVIRERVVGSVAIVPGDRPRAWTLVREGQRVLLVEVDLRRGVVVRRVDLTRLGLPPACETEYVLVREVGTSGSEEGARTRLHTVRNIVIGWEVSGDTLVLDVDGDGDLDVVCWVGGTWVGPGPDLQVPSATSHPGSYLIVLERCGNELRPVTLTTVDFIPLAAGDVNGDGRDELVLLSPSPLRGLAGQPPYRVQIVKVEDGGLTTVTEIPVSEGWASAWLIDVTGDGRPELLISTGRTLTAYEIRGEGAVASWRVKGEGGLDRILPVDRDGDGVLDALVLLYPGTAVEIAQGGGKGGAPATVPVIPVVPVVPRVRRAS